MITDNPAYGVNLYERTDGEAEVSTENNPAYGVDLSYERSGGYEYIQSSSGAPQKTTPHNTGSPEIDDGEYI